MLDPLTAIRVPPAIAALPKADLHVHAESYPRLDRVLARRDRRAAHDWHAAVLRLIAERPPGTARLARMNGDLNTAPLEALDAEPEWFIARVEDVLLEAAADGAVLAEVRFGRETVYVPDLMARVREAERRVRLAHPSFRAAATLCVRFSSIAEPEAMARLLAACRKAAREGMSGVDLLPEPYDTEADWRAAYAFAERAVDAGLGITAHAGEFATTNIVAALHTPGLTRLGHAVHAAGDPALMEQIAARGITVECCLSSNVVLGAAPSYAAHPLPRFLAAGIPITLNTDDPVRLGTTIGREYAVGGALGLTHAELLACTRTALRASFLPASVRQHLLASIESASSPTMP